MANTYQPITSWTRIAPRLFSFGVMCALLAGAAVIWFLQKPPSDPESFSPNIPLNFTALQGGKDGKAKITEDASDRRAVCIAYVDVDGGVTPLYPLQPGKVVAIPVRENQEVEPGDVLIRMDDTLQKAQLEEAKADVHAGEAQLEQAKLLFKQHDLKIKGQKAVVAAKKEEMTAAAAKRDGAERLALNKLASNEDVKAAQAIVKALESAVEGETTKLNGLEAVDPYIGVTLAMNDLNARKARLSKAEYALKETTLVAPFKGSVLRINTSVGETLGPNPKLPAIMFCPSTKRIVRAEVEQEFAGKISLNQLALMQDDCSTSTQTWRGKVVRISDWYTHRRSILLEPLQFNDVRTLECIIDLDPGQPILRIGQRVRVQLVPPTDAGKAP
ncbi:biotin/lipoyl-binding protein [bacterium]|jgi:multidrug resistance efflux pump|nr:biotin/lipoyl-binding protein [bacterium]